MPQCFCLPSQSWYSFTDPEGWKAELALGGWLVTYWNCALHLQQTWQMINYEVITLAHTFIYCWERLPVFHNLYDFPCILLCCLFTQLNPSPCLMKKTKHTISNQRQMAAADTVLTKIHSRSQCIWMTSTQILDQNWCSELPVTELQSGTCIQSDSVPVTIKCQQKNLAVCSHLCKKF